MRYLCHHSKIQKLSVELTNCLKSQNFVPEKQTYFIICRRWSSFFEPRSKFTLSRFSFLWLEKSTLFWMFILCMLTSNFNFKLLAKMPAQLFVFRFCTFLLLIKIFKQHFDNDPVNWSVFQIQLFCTKFMTLWLIPEVFSWAISQLYFFIVCIHMYFLKENFN